MRAELANLEQRLQSIESNAAKVQEAAAVQQGNAAAHDDSATVKSVEDMAVIAVEQVTCGVRAGLDEVQTAVQVWKLCHRDATQADACLSTIRISVNLQAHASRLVSVEERCARLEAAHDSQGSDLQQQVAEQVCHVCNEDSMSGKVALCFRSWHAAILHDADALGCFYGKRAGGYHG